MNALDRFVGFFNPEAGLRRARARAATAVLMNYDAATRGRRSAGWKAPGSSADAAAFGSRSLLRNRSRDFVRNRPYAARGRDVVVANVVGEGIAPSVRAKDDATKDAVKEFLSHLTSSAVDSLGEYDLAEMQGIVMSTVFTDGEVLIRRRMRNVRFARGLKLPYQVELLEADFLDDRIHSHGENQVIEGIEYGPTGAIEAYHLFNEHPGAVRNSKALTSTRVHWSDVIHVRRFDRPGQLRGVPWLAPVMLTLGELSDYQEAQILKQRMAALMALVLEWADGANRPADAGKGLEELAPGAIVNLPAGVTPHFTEPPKVDGYDEFMRRGLSAVAVGLGVTYESISGDLKGVNFSSGRMGRMEMDRLVKMWQRNLMIAQFCLGMERWFREGLALVGKGGLVFEMDWTPPRRILVDPTKEIPAMIEEVEAGLNSRQRTQRELGRDPDTIRQERQQDARADEDAGLQPTASSPARKTSEGDDDEGE